jgi:hypothetical protein
MHAVFQQGYDTRWVKDMGKVGAGIGTIFTGTGEVLGSKTLCGVLLPRISFFMRPCNAPWCTHVSLISHFEIEPTSAGSKHDGKFLCSGTEG